MAKDECTELREHLDRCREFLRIMRNPGHRKTISDLIPLGTGVSQAEGLH